MLLGIWNRTRTGASRRALLAGVILGPLLLAMQAWVVTDREQLEAAIRQMSAAVEAGDVPRIAGLFDPQVSFAGGRDLGDFEEHLAWLLERYDVQEPKVGAFEVSWDTDQAVVRCAASCRVTAGTGAFPVRSRWELRFRPREGQWKVVDLRPISILDRPYESFFDIN